MERGLVHRDVKPSNIFVLEDDSVKIIDFGVAHLSAKGTLTSMKGTLHYMAPEQLQMQKPTPASDLFSLGVVCYEAFTGGSRLMAPRPKRWYRPSSTSFPARVGPQSSGEPRARPGVHKALAKQAFHRFSSAREFADLLQKALRGEAIEVFDESRAVCAYRPRQKGARHWRTGIRRRGARGARSRGYIHPDMAHLRQQINRAQREKSIALLLDNANRCYQEEEYQLALQKIQEVLRIDPQTYRWRSGQQRGRNAAACRVYGRHALRGIDWAARPAGRVH